MEPHAFTPFEPIGLVFRGWDRRLAAEGIQPATVGIPVRNLRRSIKARFAKLVEVGSW